MLTLEQLKFAIEAMDSFHTGVIPWSCNPDNPNGGQKAFKAMCDAADDMRTRYDLNYDRVGARAEWLFNFINANTPNKFEPLKRRYPYKPGDLLDQFEGGLVEKLIYKHFPNMTPMCLVTHNRMNRAIELEFDLPITPVTPIPINYEGYGYSGDSDL